MVELILPLATSPGFDFGGEYKTERTKTFEGRLATNIITFVVRNRNCVIYVSTWDSSEYKVELNIRAKSLTVGDAVAIIDGLDIDIVEERIQNQLRLVLEYNITEQTWRMIAIQVTAYLPTDAKADLDLESSNGGMYLTDIEGGTIQSSLQATAE